MAVRLKPIYGNVNVDQVEEVPEENFTQTGGEVRVRYSRSNSSSDYTLSDGVEESAAEYQTLDLNRLHDFALRMSSRRLAIAPDF